VIAIVPARGGSKVVPRKNLREVGGRPLIAWTIAAAREAQSVDRVVVSSDDPEIVEVAEAFGADVPFVRDVALARDDTPTIDVVIDGLTRCPGFAQVVVLQPTSPLRNADDIDAAVDRCRQLGAPSCVSVTEVSESPYWMYRVDAEGRMRALLPDAAIARRQDLPAVYHLNGAVYVAATDWLVRERSFVTSDSVAYIMPAERSLDIDTEDDLLRAGILLRV